MLRGELISQPNRSVFTAATPAVTQLANSARSVVTNLSSVRLSTRSMRRNQPDPLDAVPCRADWRVARLFFKRLALEGAWRCWRAVASKHARRWPPHQTFGTTQVLSSVAATCENDGDNPSELRDDLQQADPALSPAPMPVRSSGGGLSWTPPSSEAASMSGRTRSSGGGFGSSGWDSSRPPPAYATPSRTRPSSDAVSAAGARQAGRPPPPPPQP